ncbi:MAG: type 4a pilus biogenesis protein PilO [Candidatus Rokuibacteriota bacterium]
MNAILQTWRDASRVQQLGLTGLGLVALGVACYVLVLSPTYARQAALESRLAALERELAEAQIQVDGLARHRQAKVGIEKQLELMVGRLFATREIPPLYQILQETAAHTGLALALFRPHEPKVENHYTEIPIAVTAQGTYHRLARFLARIVDLPKVVTIDELKITALGRPQVSLRAEMVLTAYVYRPVGTPHPARAMAPTGAIGAPKGGRSPSP